MLYVRVCIRYNLEQFKDKNKTTELLEKLLFNLFKCDIHVYFLERLCENKFNYSIINIKLLDNKYYTNSKDIDYIQSIVLEINNIIDKLKDSVKLKTRIEIIKLGNISNTRRNTHNNIDYIKEKNPKIPWYLFKNNNNNNKIPWYLNF